MIEGIASALDAIISLLDRAIELWQTLANHEIVKSMFSYLHMLYDSLPPDARSWGLISALLLTLHGIASTAAKILKYLAVISVLIFLIALIRHFFL